MIERRLQCLQSLPCVGRFSIALLVEFLLATALEALVALQRMRIPDSLTTALILFAVSALVPFTCGAAWFLSVALCFLLI